MLKATCAICGKECGRHSYWIREGSERKLHCILCYVQHKKEDPSIRIDSILNPSIHKKEDLVRDMYRPIREDEDPKKYNRNATRAVTKKFKKNFYLSTRTINKIIKTQYKPFTGVNISFIRKIIELGGEAPIRTFCVQSNNKQQFYYHNSIWTEKLFKMIDNFLLRNGVTNWESTRGKPNLVRRFLEAYSADQKDNSEKDSAGRQALEGLMEVAV